MDSLISRLFLRNMARIMSAQPAANKCRFFFYMITDNTYDKHVLFFSPFLGFS